MIFGQIASILRVKGREIFQQERVDKGPSGEPATGLAKAFRRLFAHGWNRGCSYIECMTEVYGKRGLRSREPNNSEMAISCNPGAEPNLRRSESRGELSKEKSPFRFLSHGCAHRIDEVRLHTARGRNSVRRYISRCYRRWTPAPQTISH
jgi:hypothetical protein